MIYTAVLPAYKLDTFPTKICAIAAVLTYLCMQHNMRNKVQF